MEKIKLLFTYSSMIIGGSTTSLLSFMNCLDPEKYSIDLQLLRNEGPLLNMIPQHVNLLPEAEMYKGKSGRIIKNLKFIFGGYAFKSFFKGIRKGKPFDRDVISDFQVKSLCRKNNKEYDYAIGFMEGWADKYLAWQTVAKHKYAWIHVAFSKITDNPQRELSWLSEAERIVFVADVCRDEFAKEMPSLAERAISLENVLDSEIVGKRASDVDYSDEAYQRWVKSDRFKLVTVCRLRIDHKGLDRIMVAAKNLKAKGYKFLWYIIGDGDHRDILQNMIDEFQLQDCVEMIGTRMNPYPFIKESDVMCMPSRYEGKPMAVTEGLILGVPPVVAEYLSAREQIQDGVDGIIFPNDDVSVESAVEFCLNNPSVLSEMREYIKNKDYGNGEYIKTIEKELF